MGKIWEHYKTFTIFEGKWQYKFLFTHLKELLKLFNNSVLLPIDIA